MGDSIDIFATIGTVFGVATSLGFGVTQINSGLHYLFGVEQSTNIQVLLIIFVSILASLSVFLGLDKGVKRLSELNLVLALILLVFVLSLALVFIYSRLLFKILGNIYLTFYHDIQFICLSAKWMDWGWTILYWAWWISWSPFVGMFIARVSRGRTIREFIVGVLLIPTGFTIIWMGF